MCRMMGVLAKGGIKAEWVLPFENLALYGKIRSDMKEPGHHDGWGMVTYLKEGFPEYLEREPHSVSKDSQHFRNGAAVMEESKCKVALIHFRKISVGAPQISNTHPFVHGEWTFAHNGTIYDSEKIPLTKLKPAGTTDSERFFLFLLEKLADSTPLYSPIRSAHPPLKWGATQRGKEKGLEGKEVDVLRKSVNEIKNNFKHTSLTFLLTDGNSLFAYRECDPEYHDYYTLFSAEVAGGTIFCSEPLPSISQNWKPLQNGSLAVAGSLSG